MEHKTACGRYMAALMKRMIRTGASGRAAHAADRQESRFSHAGAMIPPRPYVFSAEGAEQFNR